MCDTVVATGSATQGNITLFAKNSDRDPNEGHLLLWVESRDHQQGSPLRCTYIEIPQVKHTHGILLSKPFWIWGAEMGVNEHGLAIGNEAVFSKLPVEEEPGLIGMDLLRLGLERARSCRHAIEVMTDLLERYGQGGNCGFQHKMSYHNSFLLADTESAWVLETVGRQWAAKQVEGVYSISNGLTLGREWDLASTEIISTAVDKGWCRNESDFHVARCYSDRLYTRFSDSQRRCSRTRSYLAGLEGHITIDHLRDLLRDHGERNEPYRPDRGLMGAEVCMHAGFGPVRISQTTGSMISHLDPTQPTHFFTGTAAPCTSLFKPIWVDTPLPDLGPEPQGTFDENTMFWQHELLHCSTLLDYPNRIEIYRDDRNQLEREWMASALALRLKDQEHRQRRVENWFKESQGAENDWMSRLEVHPPTERNRLLYRIAWSGYNQQAEMPPLP